MAPLEEAITVLFCLMDDAYAALIPDGEDATGLATRIAAKVTAYPRDFMATSYWVILKPG
jgi:hypothetical protein